MGSLAQRKMPGRSLLIACTLLAFALYTTPTPGPLQPACNTKHCQLCATYRKNAEPSNAMRPITDSASCKNVCSSSDGEGGIGESNWKQDGGNPYICQCCLTKTSGSCTAWADICGRGAASGLNPPFVGGLAAALAVLMLSYSQ